MGRLPERRTIVQMIRPCRATPDHWNPDNVQLAWTRKFFAEYIQSIRCGYLKHGPRDARLGRRSSFKNMCRYVRHSGENRRDCRHGIVICRGALSDRYTAIVILFECVITVELWDRFEREALVGDEKDQTLSWFTECKNRRWRHPRKGTSFTAAAW